MHGAKSGKVFFLVGIPTCWDRQMSINTFKQLPKLLMCRNTKVFRTLGPGSELGTPEAFGRNTGRMKKVY